MELRRRTTGPVGAVLLALALAACSGGGSGGGGGGSGGGAPIAPPATLAAAAGDGQVTVSWAAVGGATGYRLYWSTSPGVTSATGTQVAVSSSPFVHAGLTNGTSYYYVLTALDGAVESTDSSEVNAMPQASVVPPPASLTATAGDGEVVLTWSAVAGATGYSVHWSTGAGVVPGSATEITGVTSPHTHSGLTNGTTYYYVVTATDGSTDSAPSPEDDGTPTAPPPGPGPYDPPWASATPVATFTHDYDGGKTALQNGADLAAAIALLFPGDQLIVKGGTYSFATTLTIDYEGTLANPIWIEAATGETVVFTRPDSSQDVVSIGTAGGGVGSRYICLRGMEITGGGIGLRIDKASELWIDGNHIHHTGGGGISAILEHTDNLHLTRNEINDTASFGEGIQLGKNTPNRICRDSVVALNHVHHTTAAIQGDGIQLNWGSHGNWIVENVIHHTKYPSLFFEGTNGGPVNVIERNVAYDSQDNVFQAEGGEAIVRNNVLIGPTGNKLFDSSHNEGTLRDLTVVHNTMISSSGYGAGLFAWNGQPGLVFANNALYVRVISVNSYALSFQSGYAGGTVAGNVIDGQVKSWSGGGWLSGNVATDFEGASSFFYTWGSAADLVPSAGGLLVGSGSATWVTPADHVGMSRALPVDPGCMEAP